VVSASGGLTTNGNNPFGLSLSKAIGASPTKVMRVPFNNECCPEVALLSMNVDRLAASAARWTTVWFL
jgi:hypothetical protein